jgi:CubicO group peptidase (beta-lactamase class C family)
VKSTFFKPKNRPEDLNDGIKTSTLKKEGIDEAIINKIVAAINSGFYPNIHSLLIYKNEKLVFENYFSGRDQIWGQDLGVISHNEPDLHDVRSISKSVVSACVGIAINKGLIKDVKQPISLFFEEYQYLFEGLKKDITIEHLLTMSAGFEWDESSSYDNSAENNKIQMNLSPDPIAFVLNRPMVVAPGKKWEYNGGATQLLAAIIQKVSGKKINEFANEFIFKPLGIQNYDWICLIGTTNPAAASGLRLRSRDMLKFAILYLKEGKWKGVQVIPKAWVIESLIPKIEYPEGSYGYKFWMWNNEVKKQIFPVIAAAGNGDQRIYLDHKNSLIVVCTAGNYNNSNVRNNSNQILKKIYSAFPFS